MRTERVWGMILGLAAMGLTACGGSPDAGVAGEPSPEAAVEAAAPEADAPPAPDAGKPVDAGRGEDADAATDAHEAVEAAAAPDASDRADAQPVEASEPDARPQPTEPCDAADCTLDDGGATCVNAEFLGCAPYTGNGAGNPGICGTVILPDGAKTYPYQCSKLTNDSFGCLAPTQNGGPVPDNVACCPNGGPNSADPSPFCPTT
jgi:hypothetical protein